MSENMAQISARSREAILSAIREKSLFEDFSRVESNDPVVHLAQNSSEDALTQMKRKMSENKFIVEDGVAGNLEDKINEITAQYGYTKMLYGTGLGLDLSKINATQKVCFDKPIENLRKEVFHSEFSIIHADFGIATHGVVCVTSSPKQPRMLSLAPTLCIILLDKNKVLNSLAEALNLVKFNTCGGGGAGNSSGNLGGAGNSSSSANLSSNFGENSSVGVNLNANLGDSKAPPLAGGVGEGSRETQKNSTYKNSSENSALNLNSNSANSSSNFGKNSSSNFGTNLAINLSKKLGKNAKLALNSSDFGCLPTNTLFIAGPSRTADIELITVFGVHGSQKVHIVIY